MTEIEAIYREAGEMKMIPGTCHPLAGKKKSRSEAKEKQNLSMLERDIASGNEYLKLVKRVRKNPSVGNEVDTEGNVIEQYQGPSIDEIEQELERYRQETEEQVRQMLSEAQAKADKVVEEGKTRAFQLIQDSKEKVKIEEDTGKAKADQILDRAKLEVERMIKEAEMKVAEIEHEAYQRGYDAGREVGFKKGQAEVRRLIDRLGTIVGKAIDIREDIIQASEKQMVEMILIIARKVIKDEIFKIQNEEVII
jgi:flagellar assembly protein FliH